MTKEQLKEEIVRCGKSPAYFIGKYCKIRHPTRGLISFALFDYQEELLRDYQSHRFNIVLKARQLGISEVTAAYACWLMLFYREKNILVMATKAETAKNIIKKVATAMKNLPSWLMLSKVTTDNKLSIELENGSQIKAIASSDDAGRSEALSLLILDEAAFVKNMEELWTGLLPTVTTGGSVIVLSTPNGVGNKFHEIYTEADQGQNDFKPTKLMWWRHPERISDLQDDPNRPGFKTSSWYRNEIKSSNMSERDVGQELECNFATSGETVISFEGLKWVGDGVLDPLERKGWDRNIFVWWKPKPLVRYLIVADVARGDAKDNSAAHVFEVSSMEQQAEYYGKVPPEQFARILADLGHEYNNALVVIENNHIGLACLEHLRLFEYENVYYSRKGDNKPGEIINTKWGTIDTELVPGFTTSQKTRPLIVAKLDEYVRNKSMVIRSKRFHEELKTFIYNNGRPEAMRGKNDDLVISAAIACWIRDTFLMPNMSSSKITERMAGAISIDTRRIDEVDGASKDPRHIKSQSRLPRDNPFHVRMPDGSTMDMSWVIGKG